jgi:DNA-binding transcriptional ArsR family regulator
MREVTELLKIISDRTRLRILMLLQRKELCVCQLMAVLGISQPLVSRNLSLLMRAGFLEDRREGKMIFYKINTKAQKNQALLIDMLEKLLVNDETLKRDIKSLSECSEYQKKTGKCGLKAYLEYMEGKKRGKL